MLGCFAQSRGAIDEAEERSRQALAIYQAYDLKTDMAHLYYDRGRIYDENGDLDQAEAMYQRALSLYRESVVKRGATERQERLQMFYEARVQGCLAAIADARC